MSHHASREGVGTRVQVARGRRLDCRVVEKALVRVGGVGGVKGRRGVPWVPRGPLEQALWKWWLLLMLQKALGYVELRHAHNLQHANVYYIVKKDGCTSVSAQGERRTNSCGMLRHTSSIATGKTSASQA